MSPDTVRPSVAASSGRTPQRQGGGPPGPAGPAFADVLAGADGRPGDDAAPAAGGPSAGRTAEDASASGPGPRTAGDPPQHARHGQGRKADAAHAVDAADAAERERDAAGRAADGPPADADASREAVVGRWTGGAYRNAADAQARSKALAHARARGEAAGRPGAARDGGAASADETAGGSTAAGADAPLLPGDAPRSRAAAGDTPTDAPPGTVDAAALRADPAAAAAAAAANAAGTPPGRGIRDAAHAAHRDAERLGGDAAAPGIGPDAGRPGARALADAALAHASDASRGRPAQARVASERDKASSAGATATGGDGQALPGTDGTSQAASATALVPGAISAAALPAAPHAGPGAHRPDGRVAPTSAHGARQASASAPGGVPVLAEPAAALDATRVRGDAIAATAERAAESVATPSSANAFALPTAAAPIPIRTEAPAEPAPLPSYPVTVPVHDPRFPDALGERVTWMVREGLQGAELTLNPQDLGPIRIELRLDGDAASIGFSVAQAETRGALEQALPRLREMLAGQGLQLGGAAIDAGGARQGGDGGQSRAGRGDGRGPLTTALGPGGALPVADAAAAPARSLRAGRVDVFA